MQIQFVIELRKQRLKWVLRATGTRAQISRGVHIGLALAASLGPGKSASHSAMTSAHRELDALPPTRKALDHSAALVVHGDKASSIGIGHRIAILQACICIVNVVSSVGHCPAVFPPWSLIRLIFPFPCKRRSPLLANIDILQTICLPVGSEQAALLEVDMEIGIPSRRWRSSVGIGRG
jgi:hypothetical protein